MSREVTRLEHLDRRNWWMWIAAFVLIIALTPTIPALQHDVLQLIGVDSGMAQLSAARYEALVVLLGLVCLFILYIILKQRELQVVRTRLAGDLSELEDVRSRLSEVSAVFNLATSLYVGGTVTAASNQVAGSYSAEVELTAAYTGN